MQPKEHGEHFKFNMSEAKYKGVLIEQMWHILENISSLVMSWVHWHLRNDKQGELDRLDYEKAEQNKREKKMQLPNMVCELIYAIYIMHFVEKM